MAIQKGWVFPRSAGFTGSAGAKSVKGYMRGGHVTGPKHAHGGKMGHHHEMKHGGEMHHMAKGGHWIAGATKNKGALHRALGVPEGKKIPEKKLERAEHSKNPTMRRRAALAETLKGMHHKKGGMHKKYAIGGLVTKGEYSDERAETVKPGGAQQFARGGRVMRAGKNNGGIPKLAPRPFPPSDERSSEVKPGGSQHYAKGGMATLGRDYETPGKGKFADFKRGGKAKMMKRGGGRC